MAIAGIAFVLVAGAVMLGVWRHQRSVSELGSVSAEFVGAVSRLDIVRARQCLDEEGMSMVPDMYAEMLTRECAKINKGVRTVVDVKVMDVDIDGARAVVTLKRHVRERGERFGNKVASDSVRRCQVACVYDGEHWRVDLRATLRDHDFPMPELGPLEGSNGEK